MRFGEALRHLVGINCKQLGGWGSPGEGREGGKSRGSGDTVVWPHLNARPEASGFEGVFHMLELLATCCHSSIIEKAS